MKKTAPKKTAPKLYSVSAKIMGKMFKSEGETISEAISKLKVGMARGNVILVVSNGEITKERIIGMVSANRLFNSRGLTQQVALKNINTLFKKQMKISNTLIQL